MPVLGLSSEEQPADGRDCRCSPPGAGLCCSQLINAALFGLLGWWFWSFADNCNCTDNGLITPDHRADRNCSGLGFPLQQPVQSHPIKCPMDPSEHGTTPQSPGLKELSPGLDLFNSRGSWGRKSLCYPPACAQLLPENQLSPWITPRPASAKAWQSLNP